MADGLTFLAIPLVVLWLVVAVLRLRRRVRDLDARLKSLTEQAVAQASASAGVPLDLIDLAVASASTSRPADSAAEAAILRSVVGVPSARPTLASRPVDAIRAASDLDEDVDAVTRSASPAPASGAAVVGPTWTGRLVAWLMVNWIYAISATSLAFAGMFLLQYGAERGLLTPGARVLAAIALGLALLTAGEVVRRRSGDEGPTSTRTLPSTFSAAGFAVIYLAILAARGLYGLIGPEAAFAGLLATALVGLVFGWFYGPFLAAGALLGAGVAPFLIGGSGGDAALLHAYFGLLALSGLGIDAMRRWGWVSGLALGVAYGGACLVWAGLGGTESFVALLFLLAMAAVVLPRLDIRPSHPSPSVSAWLWTRASQRDGTTLPVTPTVVASGGILGTSVLLWLAAADSHGHQQFVAFCALALLALVLALWPARAPGLEDAAVAPTIAALAVIPVVQPFAAQGADGNAWPWGMALTSGLFLLVAVAAHVRGRGDRFRDVWAGASTALPFAAAAIMEVFWQPATIIGAGPWALHVMVAAGVMTAFAVRSATEGTAARRHVAYAALSSLSLIALALVVLLSDAALTVAFAVLVAVAAALDRRFRLPEMTWFVLIGIAALGWRLIALPGLGEYLESGPQGASWGEVLLAFVSALVWLWVAMALLPRRRAATRASVESALLAYAGVFACVVAYRITAQLTSDLTGEQDGLTHWSVGLCAVIWGGLALAQAYRAGLGGPLSQVRRALA